MNKQEKYKQKLLKDSNTCPHCGSDNITAEPFNPDGNYFDVECLDCNCSWQEVYELVDIDNIKIPKE